LIGLKNVGYGSNLFFITKNVDLANNGAWVHQYAYRS